MNWSNLPLSDWMWTGEPDAALHTRPEFVLFRKEFTLAALPDRCEAKVSADSRYKLFVNGECVEFGPEKGDRSVWFYETVDLLPHLRTGQNTVAAAVLRYPLLHDRGCHSVWRTETPGFYFSAEAEENGETRAFLADRKWKWRRDDGARIVSEAIGFAPLQLFGETAGADWKRGWLLPGYDESGWQDAVPYIDVMISKAVSPGNLLPRPVPPLYQRPGKLSGVVCVRESAEAENGVRAAWDAVLRGNDVRTVPAHSCEVVELSANEYTTAFLQMRAAGGAGTELRVLYSECYAYGKQDLFSAPKKGDRTDWKNGELFGYSDGHTFAGWGTAQEPEVFEPFWFRAFRYLRVEIRTADAPLTVCGIDFRETGYPLEVRTKVETSDATLGPVWEISERTLRRCMHETYEDCPFYEQLQYVMDSRSQMLYTYAVSADDRLARKCMDDFRRSARYDGLLNASYPCYGPNVIPGFSIYYIWMLHDHMMYFGDPELIRFHLPTVDGILEYFRRILDTRGLVSRNGGLNGVSRYWSFIDWCEEWTTGVPNAVQAGPITMESFLYLYGLMAAEDLAWYVGRDGVAKEYAARAGEMRAAIRAHCLGENGLYQDGPGFEEYSEHCQVFAVLTETAGPEESVRLMREITDQRSGGGKRYARCSVAMAFYLFRALEKTGLYERTEPLWDAWRRMVEEHLSTSVESDPDPRSDCHAWGALALYELPSAVLGVRPAAPGYAEIRVCPQVGAFTHAEGKVITPRGTVYVQWKKNAAGGADVQWRVEETEKR